MELLIKDALRPNRGPTIVVVDDNDSVLAHVVSKLDSHFHVIGAVRNAPTALNIIERLRPDVAILDVSLGDSSGIDVANELRARGCAANIIFLSIHEDPEFVNAAFIAGGAAYVSKPSMAND